MNSGERLIGEHEGLVVDPDQGGALTADTLHPANAGAHPTLTATSEDVVDLDDGNEVRGFNIDPTATAAASRAARGDTGGGTIDDVNIVDTGTAGTQPGLELNGTTGTFNVSNFTYDNTDGSRLPLRRVRLNNAGTVNFEPATRATRSRSTRAAALPSTGSARTWARARSTRSPSRAPATAASTSRTPPAPRRSATAAAPTSSSRPRRARPGVRASTRPARPRSPAAARTNVSHRRPRGRRHRDDRAPRSASTTSTRPTAPATASTSSGLGTGDFSRRERRHRRRRGHQLRPRRRQRQRSPTPAPSTTAPGTTARDHRPQRRRGHASAVRSTTRTTPAAASRCPATPAAPPPSAARPRRSTRPAASANPNERDHDARERRSHPQPHGRRPRHRQHGQGPPGRHERHAQRHRRAATRSTASRASRSKVVEHRHRRQRPDVPSASRRQRHGGRRPANGIVLNTTGNAASWPSRPPAPAAPAPTQAPAAARAARSRTHGRGQLIPTPAGTGIVLNSTRAPSFARMLIRDHPNYGIRGTDVAGFSLDDSVITASGNGFNGTTNTAATRSAALAS